MRQTRSNATILTEEWGDFTGETERNVQHNAREAQLDREEREGGKATENSKSRTYRSPKGKSQSMFVPIVGPAEQAQIAGTNLGMAMKAIQRENDSRVAQRREMRRIGADYETERLRQMGANYRANVDAEAQLIRQLLADM